MKVQVEKSGDEPVTIKTECGLDLAKSASRADISFRPDEPVTVVVEMILSAKVSVAGHAEVTYQGKKVAKVVYDDGSESDFT